MPRLYYTALAMIVLQASNLLTAVVMGSCIASADTRKAPRAPDEYQPLVR